MICKKCSAENPEEAVFCQHCGKRLDGRIACPKCGTLNSDEANFCIQCGAKLNGKSICTECDTMYEGNFCPKCGTGAPKAQTASAKSKPQASALPELRTGWRKILEFVAGGLCMAGVLFAVIFTFLIGVTSTNAEGVGMIYEFFGSAYTDIADAIGTGSFDASALFTMYYPVAAGTLIVAATLVTVLTLAIFSVVRYVKFTMGKSEKDYAKFSAATVLAFLTGTVAFYALNSAIAGSSGSGVGTTVTTQFSPATVAGIVLASVFFAMFAGCRIAVNAKDVFMQKRLATLILSAVGVVAFSIALHFAGVGIAKASYASSSSVTTKIGGGYSALAALVLTNMKYDGSGYYLPDKFVVPSILGFVGLLFQLALFVLLACAIVKFLGNLTSYEENGTMKYSIPATVFTAAHLVFAIVSCVLLVDATGLNATKTVVTVSYAYPIVALVFALCALGVAIAHSVLLKKQRQQASEEEFMIEE